MIDVGEMAFAIDIGLISTSQALAAVLRRQTHRLYERGFRPESLAIVVDPVDVESRFVSMEGLSNLRDIGGYQTESGYVVRRKLVYRSARLSSCTDSDLRKLGALDIGSVYDLRTDKEKQRAPDRLPPGVVYRHLPIFRDEPFNPLVVLTRSQHELHVMLQEVYLHDMIDEGAKSFAALFEEIVGANSRPVLFHCTGGKDRTGVASALLLALLGVPDEKIVEDFTLTNLTVPHLIEELRTEVLRSPFFWLNIRHFMPILVAPASLIVNTLTHVRSRYGSVERYLKNAGGLSDRTIDTLCSILLEKGDQVK